MTSGYLGLLMLALIVIVIMMGFPTAFTLMGLGMVFGAIAYFDPAQAITSNKILDLMVQRTYGGMTNDTLLSIPLFVFMGYVIERAALVDKMFHSVQLAFRNVPGSLAVATLIVCTFWGIASGIVGAVVVLMGVIAYRPMLKAGYDPRLGAGVITAGGTLGILIPPSVMIIVYAAVAGESVVKLYAAAMFPGFFLAFMYLVYVIGWAMINPKIAPKLPEELTKIELSSFTKNVQQYASSNVFWGMTKSLFAPKKLAQHGVGYFNVVNNWLVSLFPLLFTAVCFLGAYWYIVIYNAPVQDAPVNLPAQAVSANASATPAVVAPTSAVKEAAPQELGKEEAPQELGKETTAANTPAVEEKIEEMGTDIKVNTKTAAPGSHIPSNFFAWFWGLAGLAGLWLAFYYKRMHAERFELLRMLLQSVMPLAILTLLVLVVILFGITTATESAAIGALGALYLAAWASYPRMTLWASLPGLAVGAIAAVMMNLDAAKWVAALFLGAMFIGSIITWGIDLIKNRRMFSNLQQSTFLTAKTTAMVCWLFVGSALFSAVFAIHGGQEIIEKWVLSLSLSPMQFLILSQAIIFFLGWPLEWTEIIVIFVPIFIPLLKHFEVDPILFATMVAVNLQAAFLSPPVAMSAFYLKGVAPPHISLNTIFAGMMPYMFIVILCLVIMYIWPGLTLWLPNFLYGK